MNPLSIAIDEPLESANSHTNLKHPNNFENGWDALDALVVTSDIPIPPMQSFTQEIEIVKDVDESESEGFGDFVGTADESATDVVVNAFKDAAMKTDALQSPVANGTSDKSIPSNIDVNDIQNNTDANASNHDYDLDSGTSGRDGFHVPPDTFSKYSNVDAPKDSNGTTDAVREGIHDEFVDFDGEEGDTSNQECTAPSSTTFFRPEFISNFKGDDPFDTLDPSEPAILSRPIIMYDRADSTYYSAQAKSVSSDSDYNNFEDATMNDSEVDTVNAEINEVDPSNVYQNEQDIFSSDVTVVSNDPFSTLSSNSAVEPAIHMEQQLTNDFNLMNEFNTLQEENVGDFDAFKDFQGISNKGIDGFESKEAATGQFLDHTEASFPHNNVSANSTDDFLGDDFGDFETMTNPVTKDGSQIPNEAETINEDEFGNFDDFGAFEASVPSATSIQASPEHREIKAGFVVESDEDWIWTRGQIILMANNLPKPLRQTSHGLVDFGACFDANIQQKFPLSESRIHQIIRSVNLMDRLSSSQGEELSLYWVQLLRVVKTELVNGAAILQDASTLDPGDLAFILKNLKMYLCGLKEFVRVSRCIIATVSDLLLLDVFTMLSNEALALSFQSNNLAVEAYEIEQLWEKIYAYDTRLGMGAIESISNRLEDMVEIRSRLFDNAIDSVLCDFTLQPLPNPIKIDSTQNVFTWSDKTYIVCAANLLSNTTDYFTRQS